MLAKKLLPLNRVFVCRVAGRWLTQPAELGRAEEGRVASGFLGWFRFTSGFKGRVSFFPHSASGFVWSSRRNFQEISGNLNPGSFWPLDFILIPDHPGGWHVPRVS